MWHGRFLTVSLTLFATACCTPRLTEGDEQRIRAELLLAVRAFEAAQRTLDPVAVLPFLAPDFTMLQDGMRVGYDATVQQIRSTLPALRELETHFDDVAVIPLGHDAALTSMSFRDTVIDADGVVTRMHGPSTLLWRLRHGTWQIVFADSDHYPDER